ncbi:unnamed protein product, partial [Ectocarpus sp. 4 AP-2014]
CEDLWKAIANSPKPLEDLQCFCPAPKTRCFAIGKGRRQHSTPASRLHSFDVEEGGFGRRRGPRSVRSLAIVGESSGGGCVR